MSVGRVLSILRQGGTRQLGGGGGACGSGFGGVGGGDTMCAQSLTEHLRFVLEAYIRGIQVYKRRGRSRLQPNDMYDGNISE